MNTLQTIARINQIKQLNALQSINKINTIQSINPINNKLQEVTDTVTSSLTDYNNPLEINSLSDALFNTDARKLKYGKATGTVLRAAWDHIKEHTIDPMLKGDWATVGMNALTGFSEDMDLFARPFKALTIGGKEAAAQDRERNRSDYAGTIGGTVGGGVGAIAGAVIGSIFPGVGTAVGAALGGALGGTVGTLTGAISGEITDSFFADREPDNSKLVGRINYDYDTGNFFSDMALEIVSDPTGWVDIITDIATLGTSGAIKATSRTATKTVTKMATEAGESLSKQATKVIRKGIKRTLKQTTKEAAEASVRTVGDAVNLLKGTHAYKALSKEPLSDYTFKYISDLKLNKIISDDTIKLYNRTSTILNTLDQISNGIEIKPFSKFDKAPAYFRNYKMKVGGIDPSRGLLKLSSLGNPISASAYLGSRFIKPLAGLGKSSRIKYLMTHTDGIDPKTGAINAEKYAKVFTTAATADATFRLLFNESGSADLNLLLERMTKKSVEVVYDKIINFTNDINKANTSIEKFSKAQELIKYLDSVFGTDTSKLTPEELIRRIFDKYAPGSNVEELNNYIKSISSSLEYIKDSVDVIKKQGDEIITLQNELNELTQLRDNILIISKSIKNSPGLLNLLDYYKIILEDTPLAFKINKTFKNSLKDILANHIYRNDILNSIADDISKELTAEQVLDLLRNAQKVDFKYLNSKANTLKTPNDLYKIYKSANNEEKAEYLYPKIYKFIADNLNIKVNNDRILTKYNSIKNRIMDISNRLKVLDKSLKDSKELIEKNKGIIDSDNIKIRVYKDELANRTDLDYLKGRFTKDKDYIDIPYSDLMFSTGKVTSSDYYDDTKIKKAIDMFLLTDDPNEYAYISSSEIIGDIEDIFKNHPEQFIDLFKFVLDTDEIIVLNIKNNTKQIIDFFKFILDTGKLRLSNIRKNPEQFLNFFKFILNNRKITASDIKKYPERFISSFKFILKNEELITSNIKNHPEQVVDFFRFIINTGEIADLDIKKYSIEKLINAYKNDNSLRSIVKKLNESIEEKIARNIYDIRAHYAPQLRKYPEGSYEYHKIEIEMDAAIAGAMHRSPTTIDEYSFTVSDLSEKLQDIYNKYNLFKTKLYEAYQKAVSLDEKSVSQNIHLSTIKKLSNDEVMKIYEVIDMLKPYIDYVMDPQSASELKKLLNITEESFTATFPKANNLWSFYETLFKNISNMFKDAQALYNLRNNIINFVETYLNTVSNKEVSSILIANTILSNLQHLYKVDVDFVKNCTSPEMFDAQTKFFTNVDTALYSSAIHKRYNQATVAQELKIEVKEGLHTAAEDTKLTEQIFHKIQESNPNVTDGLLERSDKPKIFFDTETTNLKENTDFREIYLKLEGDDKPGCMLYFDVDELTFNSFSRDFKINLLQLTEKEADELTYTEWYNTKYLPSIQKNTEGTFRAINEPPKNPVDNLLTLYDYLKEYCTNADGMIDFVPVGFNSNKFDNVRIYNLIDRTLNNPNLDADTISKLKILRSIFEPTSTQMKTAVDVYQLFLQQEAGILQLNSAVKWKIFKYLKGYADNKSDITSLMSFDIYRLNGYFKDLKALFSSNGIVNSEISDMTNNLFDNIKNGYKQTYIQLPSKYEVVYTGPDGSEQHFISLESFYSTRNIHSYSETSVTTKNIFNDNVFKFFEDNNTFKAAVLENKYHNRTPYKVTNSILKIADNYKYTARLKDPDVIEELKRAFKFLTEIDEETGFPKYGKKITFIEYMKEPTDPVELMAAVQYLVPKEYTPYVISSVNDSVVEFFKTNNFPLIADIFERNTLYQKNNNKIIYDYGDRVLSDSLNITNEITNTAERMVDLSDGVDSLSSRRYLVTASELSALNEHIKPTVDYLDAVQKSTKAKKAYNEYVEEYLQEIYDNTIKGISDLNDEQLITFYLQQGRIIAFQDNSANPILTNLMKRLESNKNFIVTLAQTEDGELIYWTGLRKSVQSFYSSKSGKYRLSKFGKELEPVTLDLGHTDKLIDPKGNELLSKLRTSQENNIKYFNTFIDENNYSEYPFNPKGVITSEARYSSVFDKAPKELLDELPTKEVLLSPKNINWSNPFNLSFNLIGTDRFKKTHFGIQDPTDLFSSYYQAIRTVIQKQTTKQQVGSIFESALGFTSFNKFSNPDFNLAKAREMANYAAENPEYRLYARVIYQNKQGKTIDKIITLPNSEYTIMEVFNKGYTVSLETVQNGSIMMDVFNYKIDNSVFNTANLILRLFKITTLASTGSIMRNALDSYLKNVEDMGVVSATVNTYKAMVIKHNWHKCYREILLNSQYEINLINPKWWENSVHLYFNGAERHGIDELTFMYLYSFFNDGPSSAILQDLEMVKNYRTAYTFGTGKATATVPNLKKWYNTNKKTINPKTFEKQNEEFVNKLFSTLIAPNIYIEQVNRLAMFLKYTEDGYLKTTQIYKKIADTHFDFTYKNNLHKTIELLIPFYSFTKDNALFWLRVAENNPIFFKRLMDMMTPVMDLDDYTRDELERNKSLVNQIRTGQIKIMPDADLTLKMNPSFLDVMNIFTNPVEALEQRLVSPAALALKHAEQFIVQNQYGGYTVDNGDILNMLPVIGTANVRYEAAKRNLERIDKKQNLTDTQKLAAKPFAAISSTFGVTQRYPIYKYETDRYYSTRSSQYYKNNTILYKSGISSRPKKVYYPMEKPAQYSSSYYKFLYIKSLQRYFNT